MVKTKQTVLVGKQSMSMLAQMEIFYFVAIWKSFSKAALELGVSKSYISNQITALEKSLKVKLLYRSTRHLSLTNEGKIFFESCSRIMQEQQNINTLLKETKNNPAGQLKITAPPSMCNSFLAALIPQFQDTYPNITLSVDSSSAIKNLLQYGIDVALRVTRDPDENYVAQMIGHFRFIVCATPAYLAQQGTPKKFSELAQHNCLIYSADPAQQHWPFKTKNHTETITVQGNLITTNSTIIKHALLANKGIARLPEYVINKEIAEGKITALFSQNTQTLMPLYAIYANTIYISPKIKCLINFLKKNLNFSN